MTLAIIIVLLIASCRAFTAATPQPEITLPSSTAPSTSTPRPATPSPSPTQSPPPLPSPTLSPAPPTVETYTVRTHPDGPLYAGDQVSFEVIAPEAADLSEHRVTIQVDAPEGPEIGAADFGPFGIAGRIQATLIWAWDTSGLEPGGYRLTFTVEPAGVTWEEIHFLYPEEQVPPPEPHAEWASAESECCILHYITGTEAERDLPLILEQAEDQARLAAERIGADFDEPIAITLLPRVLGHGGFAGQEISVSYLERNYAGSQFEIVLLHEMIHILDQRLGGELRPSILVEGLAVYLTGGHFKPEPLMPRAAALLNMPAEDKLGWYLPLEPLADNFYASQHEIGYLIAGALVEYMVDRWGWEAFSAFYRDIKPHESESQARAIEAALVAHFGLALSDLEGDFLSVLQDYPDAPEWMEDVRLTADFYDTVRRYQRALDPSAYFRTAWLLSNEEMRKQGIVADYLRRPALPENVSIETLLAAASEHLIAGQYVETGRYLEAINAALDVLIETEAEPARSAYRMGSNRAWD